MNLMIYLVCYYFTQIPHLLLWILRSSWYELRKWRNTTGQCCYLLITADTMTSYHSRRATLERVIPDKDIERRGIRSRWLHCTRLEHFSELYLYILCEYIKFCIQWRRLHRARGHGPPLLQMAGTGAPSVEELQKRNWPNCNGHHESTHQNDWLYF